MTLIFDLSWNLEAEALCFIVFHDLHHKFRILEAIFDSNHLLA